MTRWIASIAACAALGATPAQAQQEAYQQQTAPGATVTQTGGTGGHVPMTQGPSGLVLAHHNVNETVPFLAKLTCPQSFHPSSFTVYSYSDAWGMQGGTYEEVLGGAMPGQGTATKAFTAEPWDLDNVESQCAAALTNPDGSFKSTAQVTLVSDGEFYGDAITFSAHCAANHAPNDSSLHQVYEGLTNPSTAVTCQLTSVGILGGAKGLATPGAANTVPAVPQGKRYQPSTGEQKVRLPGGAQSWKVAPSDAPGNPAASQSWKVRPADPQKQDAVGQKVRVPGGSQSWKVAPPTRVGGEEE